LSKRLTALTGNPSLPTPNPTLAVVTAGADNLEAAYSTTQANKQAVKTSVTDQTIKEDDLVQLLSQLASYVENRAGDDETKITSAGHGRVRILGRSDCQSNARLITSGVD